MGTPMSGLTRLSRLIAVPVLLSLTVTASTEGLRFTPEQILDWQVQSFEGHTQYHKVEKAGREAVHARCDNSASGLFLEKDIDLRQTPILEWEWRVDHTFGDAIDETRREGDDYPARVYAVVEHAWRPWRSRAINYVWASAQDKGSHWPNAYVSSVKMLAVRSGERQAGQWHTERRNLLEDFQSLHEETIETIHGLAIMSDCDDLSAQAEAWFGEIRLRPGPD